MLQLTTSRRGRPPLALLDGGFPTASTHDLTKRSTREAHEPGGTQVLQLTTSRRGRHVVRGLNTGPVGFNSRPHEEVDARALTLMLASVALQLTTSRRGRHASPMTCLPSKLLQLTTSRRGRPFGLGRPGAPYGASTHDLTKRSTSYGQQYAELYASFNSRPHEEVDYTPPSLRLSVTIASTHDLTKRST